MSTLGNSLSEGFGFYMYTVASFITMIFISGTLISLSYGVFIHCCIQTYRYKNKIFAKFIILIF